MAAAWRSPNLGGKKISHLMMMLMLNGMTFQILLPLIPLEAIGMGIDNKCML